MYPWIDLLKVKSGFASWTWPHTLTSLKSSNTTEKSVINWAEMKHPNVHAANSVCESTLDPLQPFPLLYDLPRQRFANCRRICHPSCEWAPTWQPIRSRGVVLMSDFKLTAWIQSGKYSVSLRGGMEVSKDLRDAIWAVYEANMETM